MNFDLQYLELALGKISHIHGGAVTNFDAAQTKIQNRL